MVITNKTWFLFWSLMFTLLHKPSRLLRITVNIITNVFVWSPSVRSNRVRLYMACIHEGHNLRYTRYVVCFSPSFISKAWVCGEKNRNDMCESVGWVWVRKRGPKKENNLWSRYPISQLKLTRRLPLSLYFTHTHVHDQTHTHTETHTHTHTLSLSLFLSLWMNSLLLYTFTHTHTP